jgi:glycosyltransferase involved in cell wall biosynthesis
LNTLKAIWNFNRVVQSWKPEIVILNCDLPELFGALLFKKCKLVAVEHTSKAWRTRVTLGRIVRRFLIIKKTTWAAVSCHLSIWPRDANPQVVLENSILLPEKKLKQSSKSRIKRLAFIGRLSEEKRPEIALEVARITNLEIIIIGDGVMKTGLMDKALNESIKSKFVGWTHKPWTYINEGDLLIVPSSLEGDGLTVIEGLARQVPMLLADIQDLKRFDFPEGHYCVSLADYEAAIQKNRHNIEKLVIAEEFSRPILDKRSIEVVGDAWTKFLKNL